MAHWLVKQEPSSYSWGRLVRDRRTRWDGVHNALALQHLRRMVVGEEAIFYHSGDERACVGILRIASPPRPDPNDTRGSWYVEVVPLRALPRTVPLAELRQDPTFTGIELLRNSRLSVMPLPDAAWARLLERSAMPAPARPPVTEGTPRRATPRARPQRAPARSRTR
ncbi:MAG TPA: EVE domain-containing protein [Thermoplasmata archaeon]|nr:EVE domain-containing protein [Thermoplasmata archaeon]